MLSHIDERAGCGVQEAVRGGDPDEPVAAVAAGAADRGDLGVLGEVIVQLAVACLDGAAEPVLLDEGTVGQLVHAGDELGEGVGDDEVLAVLLERLDRARGAGSDP
ncbi:hypothetical protein GCM10027270_22810 [Nocardioides ginkgobilobae]|jgi:hypothetical protein